MSSGEYHTSDLSFAAFLWMKGNNPSRVECDDRGRFHFCFCLSPESGEELMSEFLMSELSVYDGFLRKLRELIRTRRNGNHYSSRSQG